MTDSKPIQFVNAGSKPDQPDCGFGHACSFCQREASCTLDKPRHNKTLIEQRLSQIGQIIMVLANKGGVGKSTIAANLAAAIARRGFSVGLADADIHGPNAGQFFGQQGERVKVGPSGIQPRVYRSPDDRTELKLGSLGFFLAETDSPVVWRDAYKFDYIHHLTGSYNWGELDFWIIDMPPGTGNELITLCDVLEGSHLSAVLVTTPQAVALLDSLKAARFCHERGLPVLGLVENMAGMVCPHCNGEIQLFPRDPLNAAWQDIETLAQLPLSPQLAFGSDAGVPIVDSSPESVEAQAFMGLAQRCIETGAKQQGELMQHQLADALIRPEQLAELEQRLGDSAEADTVCQQLEKLLAQEQQRLRDT